MRQTKRSSGTVSIHRTTTALELESNNTGPWSCATEQGSSSKTLSYTPRKGSDRSSEKETARAKLHTILAVKDYLDIKTTAKDGDTLFSGMDRDLKTMRLNQKEVCYNASFKGTTNKLSATRLEIIQMYTRAKYFGQARTRRTPNEAIRLSSFYWAKIVTLSRDGDTKVVNC